MTRLEREKIEKKKRAVLDKFSAGDPLSLAEHKTAYDMGLLFHGELQQSKPPPDLLQSVGEATGIKTTSPKGQSRKIGQPSIYQTTGGFKQMELPGFGDVPFDPSNPKRPFRTGLTSSVDPEEFVSKIVRKGAQGQAITMTDMNLVDKMSAADDNMVKNLLEDGKITKDQIDKYQNYMRNRIFGPSGPAEPGGDAPRGKPSPFSPVEPAPYEKFEDHGLTEGPVTVPDHWSLPGFDKPKTPDSFDGDLDFGSIIRRMLFQIGTAGVGAAIGGIAGGKQGALAGAGIGSKLAGQAVGIHDQLKQRGIANKILETRAQTALTQAQTAQTKEDREARDALPQSLKSLQEQVKEQKDPRARAELIESFPENMRVHFDGQLRAAKMGIAVENYKDALKRKDIESAAESLGQMGEGHESQKAFIKHQSDLKKIEDDKIADLASKAKREQFTQLNNSLRKLPMLMNGKDMEFNYGNLMAAHEDWTRSKARGDKDLGIKEIAMINSFQRLIDPATVREGDVALQRSSQSFWDQFKLQIEQVHKGKVIDESLGAQMIQTANQLLSDQRTRAKVEADAFLASAEMVQYDEDVVEAALSGLGDLVTPLAAHWESKTIEELEAELALNPGNAAAVDAWRKKQAGQ